MRAAIAVGLGLLVSVGAWSPVVAQDKPAPAQEEAVNPDALPKEEAARFQEARRLVSGKKYDDAEKVLGEVLKGHPKHEPSLMKLAEVYEKTGREQEALGLLRKHLELPESTPRVALFLASMLEHRKKREEARQVLEEASRRWTKEADVFVRLGQFYGFGDMARAEASYKRALELEPTNRTALNNQAAVFNAQARYREGYELLDRNIKANPKSVSGAFNLASSCYTTGELERGRALHKELLEKRPSDPFAISGLAIGHTLAGQYQEAEQVLAPHQKSEAPLIHYAQGLNLLFQGKAEQAEPVLAQAWKEMTGRLHIGLAYAEALRQNKKLDQAQALLQRMEGARNALPLVRPYQALLLASQGEGAQALQRKQEAIKLQPDYAAPADLKRLVRMPERGIQDFAGIGGQEAPKPAGDAGSAKTQPTAKGSSCGCVTPTVPVSSASWGLFLLAALAGLRLGRR